MTELSLCMIVKNEAEVLGRCLDSVKDVVDEIVIMDTGSTDATRQIARELEAAMNRWLPLAPSMGIACDRVAWAYRPEVREARGCDELLDAELRITFDDCLAYFDCHCFRSPWRPIIESSESVMEIKSAVPYPPWLVDVLSAERIYPASFTKYGNAYQMATAVPRARNHRRAMRGGA